jgi:hypothetical protein
MRSNMDGEGGMAAISVWPLSARASSCIAWQRGCATPWEAPFLNTLIKFTRGYYSQSKNSQN